MACLTVTRYVLRSEGIFTGEDPKASLQAIERHLEREMFFGSWRVLRQSQRNKQISSWINSCQPVSPCGDIACAIQRLVERGTKRANMPDVLAEIVLTLVNPLICKCAAVLMSAAYDRSVFGYASRAHDSTSCTC